MDLKRIYNDIKSKSPGVDEMKIRQQAWIARDRMMYEKSSNVSNSNSSAAGGGRISQTGNNYVDDDYMDDDYVE